MPPVQALQIRKPTSGDLCGLSLAALLQVEAGAVISLLPRITTPAITANEAETLDAGTLLALGWEITAFLVDSLEEARAGLPDADMRLPTQVEDAMADIATVFHWSLADMARMQLADLITWRERARARATYDDGG